MRSAPLTLATLVITTNILSAHPIPSRPYLPEEPSIPSGIHSAVFTLQSWNAADVADLLEQVYAGSNRIPLFVVPGTNSIAVVAEGLKLKEVAELIRDIESQAPTAAVISALNDNEERSRRTGILLRKCGASAAFIR